MRGALAPDPTLFVANLDGSSEIPLVFGHGTLSPDGRLLAYTSQNGQLTLMEITSKNKTVLGESFLAPRWSPDGAKIAFQRETAKGFNIFVMNADGSSLRQLTDSTEYFSLGGWANDRQSLLIQTGSKIELLNVDDGRRSILLETRYDPYGSSSAALSPDGKWLAYFEKVPGKMTPGLYLKALPDGEPRLLAQLDYWSVSSPVFSPDGQWLAIGIHNGDTGMDGYTFIVKIATCQAFPLNGLQGEIRQWLQP
jgi:TolB protein